MAAMLPTFLITEVRLMKGTGSIAIKYLRCRRGELIALIIALALVTSAMAVVLSVMNGLRNRQFDELRTVVSFDISANPELRSRIEAMDGIQGTFLYRENDIIIGGHTYRLRSIENSITGCERTKSFFKEFPESIQNGSVYMSYSLVYSLGSRPQELMYLKKGKSAALAPAKTALDFGGKYRGNSSIFSNGLMFTGLDSLADNSAPLRLGVYCTNERTIRRIKALDPTAVSWQKANQSVYSALILEKYMLRMFILILFLVILAAIRRSTYRLVISREREIAALRAMGANARDTKMIFFSRCMFMTVTALVSGSLLGRLLTANIDIVSSIGSLFIFGKAGYMKLPCLYDPEEVLVYSLLVFLLSALSSYKAVSAINRMHISEVLSHE